MSGHKTRVLYAILVILLAILVADATSLIDITHLLERTEPATREQNSSTVSGIEVRQLDNKSLSIRIKYFLEKQQKGGHLRVAVLNMDNGRVHMAGSTQDIVPGHNSRSITLKRRARTMAERFTTTHVRVWLNDRDGKPLAERLRIANLEWSPAHLSSTDYIVSLPSLRSHLVELFQQENYTLLDELCSEWRRSRHKTEDGQWALAAFEAIPTSHHVETNWREALDKVQSWRASSPGSACALVAEAMLWFRRAWIERGHHSKDELSEVALQLFEEKLKKAETILLESRQQLADNPLWYGVYMDIITQLGYGKDVVMRVFVKAVEKERSYFPPYISAAYSFLPRWGGNYLALEKFIQSAVRKAGSSEADAFYARIYWHIDSYLDQGTEIFRDTHASWPHMQKGFEALIAEYPRNNLFRNYYASYACRAGDRDTYLRVRQKLAVDAINSHAWKHNHPVDVCDHKFMQRL